MTGRSVAFLRAINVGGRRAPKDELRSPLEALGMQGVETYLGSGNILHDPVPAVGVAVMEAALSAGLGFDVELTVRTASELADLVEARPFEPAALERSVSKPQVILLLDRPEDSLQQTLQTLDHADDLIVDDRDVHWLPAQGVADSDMREVLRLIGRNTIRTVRTLERLLERA